MIRLERGAFKGGGGWYPELAIWTYPKDMTRAPTPLEVPADIAADYEEACRVLSVSPKAAAALARRCLQAVLHNHGYSQRDLAKQIDAVLNEADPRKSLPSALHQTLDAIRNFGNFSAHPITDVTTLQIVPVEPHEAEWCLDILEENAYPVVPGAHLM